MSSAETSPAISPEASSGKRRKGSHKPRGGLGKFLRARGRAPGRPAEFRERLLLEGEVPPNLDDEEAAEKAEEERIKYGKRELVSNEDRYKEAPPESEGEPEPEPEIDLSVFLEKQRLQTPFSGSGRDSDSDVDHTIMHVDTHATTRPNRKGKVVRIEWGNELAEMVQDKQEADAMRELKAKLLRDDAGRSAGPPRQQKGKSETRSLTAEPSLPINRKEEMQAFLDELLG